MKKSLITFYYKTKRPRTGRISDDKAGESDQTFDHSSGVARPSTSQASPQVSPQVSPKASSKASPQVISQASPRTSPRSSSENNFTAGPTQRVLRSHRRKVENVQNVQNSSPKTSAQNSGCSSASSAQSYPHATRQPIHRPPDNSPMELGRSPENPSSNVVLMRKVFEQAQYTQQSDACIRALHHLVAEFEFHVFYEEFCRNLKRILQFEHANPKVRNILATISAFLLSAKKKYSSENLKRRLSLNKSAGQSKRSRSAFDLSAEDCENDENRDVSNKPGARESRSESRPEHNVSTDEIILMMNEATSAKRMNRQIQTSSKASKPGQPRGMPNASSADLSCSTEPETTEDEQLHKLYRLFRNLLDFVISDVLLPFFSSVNVNTRLNAAFSLLKLVNTIEDLDVSLFGRLRASLLERLIDKSPKVRSMAAVLLYRFQDHQLPNDAVQDGLIFHLKYDTSPPVRLACLNVLLLNKDTLPALLSKTRDPNDSVREKAFGKLAKKIDFKAHLNAEQRLFLIRTGLNDRCQSVQVAFRKLVIPAWIRSYADNLVELLMGLELIDESEAWLSNQTNCELIERFLAGHFESTLSVSQCGLSKLHLILVDFCKHHLDDELLIKHELFNAETFFLWRALIKFLKSKEDALDRAIDMAAKRIQLKEQFVQLLEIETSFGSRTGKTGATANWADSSNSGKPQAKRPPAADHPADHPVALNDSSGADQSTIDENNNQTGHSEVFGNQATLVNQTSPANQTALVNQTAPANQPILLTAENSDPPLNSQNESFDPNEPVNAQPEDFSLIGLVMPKFSSFIRFFLSFCEHLNLNVNEKSDELPSHRFMFKQLIGFLANYEISDSAQKAAIAELVEQLFELNENTVKVAGYTELIMNFAYRNAHRKNKKKFFEYSMELLQRLEAKINLEEERRNNERISTKEIRDLELLNANKTIWIHELKDKLDEAVADGRFDRAHEMQREIETVKQECNRLVKEMQRMKNVLEYQDDRREAEANGVSCGQFDITHYPIEHIKLLQIFEVALQNGLNNHHSLVNYGIDRYILPGIISTDRHVRLNALMALNEACCLNVELACKYCPLYFEICEKDNSQIRNRALQGLIDQVVEHGAKLFYGCVESECGQQEDQTTAGPAEAVSQSEKSEAAGHLKTGGQTENESDQRAADESGRDSPAQADQPTASISNRPARTPTLLFRNSSADQTDPSDKSEPLINKSQFVELSAASALQAAVREQLIQKFVRFLLSHTRADDEPLKASSVLGICKLMLLGRIYSPKLLSELILLWFNASTSQAIQQDIGTFLPIYCLDQSTIAGHLTVRLPPHLTGQHSLLECFMVTVENVYRLERGQQLNSSFLNAERSNYYDSDIDVLNVIDFMLNLLEPINHAAIAIAFCERILEVLQIEREDEYMLRESFATKYLIRSLHSFALAEAGSQELQRLDELLQAIRTEDRYSELKKASITKIEKFMQKIS